VLRRLSRQPGESDFEELEPWRRKFCDMTVQTMGSMIAGYSLKPETLNALHLQVMSFVSQVPIEDIRQGLQQSLYMAQEILREMPPPEEVEAPHLVESNAEEKELQLSE